MKVKDRAGWTASRLMNSDAYGACTMRYAQRWAELMEEALERGDKLDDVAKKLSREADTEGITGFMFGCARSILNQVWEHGEDLKELDL